MNIPKDVLQNTKYANVIATVSFIGIVAVAILRSKLEFFLTSHVHLSNAADALDSVTTSLTVVFAFTMGRIIFKKWQSIRDWFVVISDMKRVSMPEDVAALRKGLEDVSATTTEMSLEMQRGFSNINTKLSNLEIKIQRVESAKEAEDKDRASLQAIRRAHIPYINKLSPELAKFAVLKSNAFIDVVLAIHAQNFYTKDNLGNSVPNPRLDPNTIREDIECAAHRVYEEGINIVGAEFMHAFYVKHGASLEEYISYLTKLISDSDNYKHARFQEKSEEFLKNFLEELHSSYLDYIMHSKNSAPANGGDHVVTCSRH